MLRGHEISDLIGDVWGSQWVIAVKVEVPCFETRETK